MNKIVQIFFYFLLSINLYSQNSISCQLLDSIIDLNPVKGILKLDSTKNMMPVDFRIVDLSGFFRKQNCRNDIKICDHVPFDLNAGYYKDIVVASTTISKDLYSFELYLCNYIDYKNIKNRWHVTVKYQITNNSILRKDLIKAMWDD